MFLDAGTNSDLAYETMFDEDDEMLNQEQTMPWFDPNYAANENDDVSDQSPQPDFFTAKHFGFMADRGGIPTIGSVGEAPPLFAVFTQHRIVEASNVCA